MLQDLAFGRLENEYRQFLPEQDDVVVCFRGEQILLQRMANQALRFPTLCDVEHWRENGDWKIWNEDEYRFCFQLHGARYFLFQGQAGTCPDADFAYESVRQLRQIESKEECFAAMTAWHLFVWYRNNQFCGCCGERTVHDSVERMLRCPACGNMIFPRISPAVIAAVTDGERLLLSKYAGRSYTRYALLAGFTEIGETLEQTVQREVMEEVGLRVKNIRYYKSQPWGVDGNVLMGFFCDLDGDDRIQIDPRELAMAQWYERDRLPAHDDGISLTREMIRVFEEGREPKGMFP